MRRRRNRREERPESLKLRLDLLDIVESVHFGIFSALGVFVSAAYVHVLPARTYGCIYMFLHVLDFVKAFMNFVSWRHSAYVLLCRRLPSLLTE